MFLHNKRNELRSVQIQMIHDNEQILPPSQSANMRVVSHPSACVTRVAKFSGPNHHRRENNRKSNCVIHVKIRPSEKIIPVDLSKSLVSV